MITGARSSDHITPLLKSLHWLPMEARIHFKILLITYKILNGKSAWYLEPLIKDYHPSRALRSSSRSLLCTPAIKSKTKWRKRIFHCSTSVMEHYHYGVYQKRGQCCCYIFIQEMFQLILILNILGFFKVLQYLIIDFPA